MGGDTEFICTSGGGFWTFVPGMNASSCVSNYGQYFDGDISGFNLTLPGINLTDLEFRNLYTNDDVDEDHGEPRVANQPLVKTGQGSYEKKIRPSDILKKKKKR